MTHLSNKTLLAGVAGAWLIAAAVLVVARPQTSAARMAGQPAVNATTAPGR